MLYIVFMSKREQTTLYLSAEDRNRVAFLKWKLSMRSNTDVFQEALRQLAAGYGYRRHEEDAVDGNADGAV